MQKIDPESKKVKVVLLLISSLTIMSMITISPSLPDMTKAFSETTNGSTLVKLTLSFPGLFIAISALIAGGFIDKFGRLKLLGYSLILYALGGVSGYWLDDLYLILAGRALLGIAVGISMTIVTTLVADYYQGRARQKFAGLQIAVMSLGGIIFISLGGILADIHWRVPFLIYFFSLFILPFAYAILREPKLPVKIEQKDTTIKSPKLIWFVFFNVMIMWILFFIIPIQIPFYLKELGINSNSMIGLAIASSTFFSAIAAISYSKIKDKFSFAQLFAVGYFLMAIAYVLIAMADTYTIVMLGMLFAGLGMGIMIPNANIWVMQLAPAEIRGKEIGRLTTFWFMGQFLSPVLLLPLLNFLPQSQLYYLIAGILLLLSSFYLVFHFIQPKEI